MRKQVENEQTRKLVENEWMNEKTGWVTVKKLQHTQNAKNNELYCVSSSVEMAKLADNFIPLILINYCCLPSFSCNMFQLLQSCKDNFSESKCPSTSANHMFIRWWVWFQFFPGQYSLEKMLFKFSPSFFRFHLRVRVYRDMKWRYAARTDTGVSSSVLMIVWATAYDVIATVKLARVVGHNVLAKW